MDTPSRKPTSWDQLTYHARSVPAPADLDLRAAIRAEITSSSVQAASLFDDVLSLFHSRWLQTSVACLAVAAVFACIESLEVVNEMAWIWQLQGPVFAGI